MQPRDFKSTVMAVIQGYPGAAITLQGLRSTLPRDYERLVILLYEKGPRGVTLYKHYRDNCGSDALVFGRDLLARASEFSGWDDDEPSE